MFSDKLQNKMLLGLCLVLISCSQARKGVGSAADEVWAPMDLCKNVNGAQLQGCFQVTLDITQNLANFCVTSLPWAQGDFVPYRILGRPHGSTVFQVLLDNIQSTTGDAGKCFQVPSGVSDVTTYEEWRAETTQILSANGVDLVDAPAGQGSPMAQEILIWPELATLNPTPNIK